MTTLAYAATRGFVTAYASSSSRGFGSSGGVGVGGGEGGNDNNNDVDGIDGIGVCMDIDK